MDRLDQIFEEVEGYGPDRRQLVEWAWGRTREALPELTREDVERAVDAREERRRAA